MSMDAVGPDDEDPRDAIHRLTQEIDEKCRPLGLYFDNMSVGTHDPALMQAIQDNPGRLRQAVEEGDEVVLMVNFIVGDIAWMKRTQDPTQHEIDKSAQVILPDPADELREKFRKATEEGKSIFDDDLGDDPA